MISTEIRITYIGGPTVLAEIGGWRMITDPALDPPGTAYATPYYTLHKLSAPVLPPAGLEEIDLVLLSHDHHFDNLDHAGRDLLGRVDRVLTTRAGAERLGGRTRGLDPWETIELPQRDGKILQITGTPARHGPVHGDRGPVTGFLLRFKDDPGDAVYISGDTVWYEGVAEVAARYRVGLALLFMGAAVVPEVGSDHLTMTAAEGVLVARAFSGAMIMPMHFEGWQHFSESRNEIQDAFDQAGLSGRLRWPGGLTVPVPSGLTGSSTGIQNR